MKKITLAVVGIIGVIALIFCIGPSFVENANFSNTGDPSLGIVRPDESALPEVINKINNAQNVRVTEEFISFNKHYNIFVDDDKVATITGKYINLTGDVFTLKDSNGNELASEKQIKRWGIKLNRLAEFYDVNGNVTGYIGEDEIKDFFRITKYKFHFYDQNRNEYAHSQEKVLKLLYEFSVYDNSDNTIFKVNQDFNLFVDSYTITKESDSDVTMTDVVFLTCIVDSIRDAAK